MACNLLGFTIILFILNHSIAILLSDSNLFIRSEIVFAQAASVLSSAKLWIEEDLWYTCNDIFKVAICVVYTDTLFSIL